MTSLVKIQYQNNVRFIIKVIYNEFQFRSVSNILKYFVTSISCLFYDADMNVLVSHWTGMIFYEERMALPDHPNHKQRR